MDNKERFVTLCRNVKRDGIEELLDWVKKSDFSQLRRVHVFTGHIQADCYSIR